MTSPKDQMTQQEIDDWLMSLGEFRLTAKKELEVIGNIHETPELLGGKD